MPMIIGSRYILQKQLGEGGMGVVHLARDVVTGDQVALKQVTAPTDNLVFSRGSDDDSLDRQLALAHEFELLAALRHPNIISVLDYGFHAGHPFFTMDFVEGGRTILEAAQGLPLEGQVALLMQMFQALAYLHRRGILHRDLKPGNVLVQGEERVRVLDFGLSVRGEAGDLPIAGTLAYLAPEVVRRRDPQPPSPASDLYAAGLVAYEIFTGEHLIKSEKLHEIVPEIGKAVPDTAKFKAPDAVQAVVLRLLDKNPEHRYPSAEDTVAALRAAIGAPHQPETEAIRESFLQSAAFVGREEELRQLSAALEADSGSLWFIGGESGVGKSRLVDELRTRALVTGVVVMVGLPGSLPYNLWRDPLRLLTLRADPDNATASVLTPLVPDIDILLGRAIPIAPPLSGEADRTRLTTAILNLFRGITKPTLLILEDLHLASPEETNLLDLLSSVTSTIPLVIVGTYRSDEAPDLPERFPTGQALHLDRLDEDAVRAMSQSMLGTAAERPEVVNFIRKEAEGNALFVVEIVRALAEEAGGLSQVGQRSLPAEVFAHGIETVLRRRLSRVPEGARALLNLASVAGREVDERLLTHLNDGQDLEGWFTVCANAVVLTLRDGRWRFSHDRLRDRLLGDLPNAANLHRRVAEGIEAVYPGSVERAGALAGHWQAAGDPDKEFTYRVQAGQAAARRGATQEALTHFERARALKPGQPEVLLGLAEVEFTLSRFDDAGEHFAAALGKVSEQPALLVQAHLGLGRVAIKRSDYDAIDEHTNAAISVGRATQNPNGVVRGLLIKGDGERVRGGFGQAQANLEEARRLSEQIDDEPLRADVLTRMGILADHMGEYERSKTLMREAYAIYERLDMRAHLADVISSLAVTASKQGDFDEARNQSERALALLREIGDRFGVGRNLVNLGITVKKLGDYAAAVDYYTEAFGIFEQIGFELGQGITMLNLATVTELLDRDEESWRATQEALRLGDRLEAATLHRYGLLSAATLLAKRGEHARAAEIGGMLLANTGGDDDLRSQIQEMLDERIDLPEGERQAAMKRGEAQALPNVVEAVMAYNTEPEA